MHPPHRQAAVLTFLASCLVLLAPSSQAELQPGETFGLDLGEATTAAGESDFGSTPTTTDELDLASISRIPGIASATLRGSMTDFDLTTGGNVNDLFRGSVATAQVDFVDRLTVNSPQVAPGTPLIVEIAWSVSGSVVMGGDSTILKQSALLLRSSSDDEWLRQNQNFGTPTVDPYGEVALEFELNAGEPTSFWMRAVAGVGLGFQGSDYINGSNNASAGASMNVQFNGAINVKTTNGVELFQWTTISDSGLDYGFRDDVPLLAQTPVLSVSHSPFGPEFVRLTWDRLAGEFYLIEQYDQSHGWILFNEAVGDGVSTFLDLPRDNQHGLFRITALVGPGNPSDTPLDPFWSLTQPPGDPSQVRVSWLTKHWETYEVETSSDGENWLFAESVDGDGGAAIVDLPATNGLDYRVRAFLK